jgi:hypothetical protein
MKALGPLLKLVAVDSFKSSPAGVTFYFFASTGAGIAPLVLVPSLRDVRSVNLECGSGTKGDGVTCSL